MFGVLGGGLSSTFADSFTRADSAFVGNDWVVFGPWVIVGNTAQRSAAGAAGFDRIWRAGSITDGFAECVPLAEHLGPMVRSLADQGAQQESCYMAYRAGAETRLGRVAYGGFPVNLDVDVLDTSSLIPDLASDALAIEAIGSTLNVYLNGSVIITATDGTHDAGVRGIMTLNDLEAVSADNYAEGI